MDRRQRNRSLLVPSIFLLLSIGNYARLGGTENIRAVQIVSLLAIGACAGILLRNLIASFSKKGSPHLK